MAYDPADLKLPAWLLRALDALARLRLPLGGGWSLGMTRPGIMLTAALLGIWAAALYSGNNLLYVTGAMFSAMAMTALWQGVVLLRRLPDLAGLTLPPLEAGTPFAFRRRLPAERGIPAVVDIAWLGDAGAVRLQGRWQQGELRLSGRIAVAARGVYGVRHVQLATAAPLGLFEVGCVQSGRMQMVVLPAAVDWQAVDQALLQLQEGDEWRDLREYAAGDPLSRVHWRKVAAGDQRWTVKRFAHAEQGRHDETLRVDMRLPGRMGPDAFEQLLGKAWYWMREHPAGRVIIGQAEFDLADGTSRRQAELALAGAKPGSLPPAGDGGLLLSLLEAK